MKLLENKITAPWLSYYRNNLLLKRLTTVLGIDILVKASGFILIPFYLRLMTQDEYGLYNYLLSIIQTFSLVLNLGLYIPQSKLYHSFETRNEKGKLLFTIAVTLFAFIALISIPVFLFRWDYDIIGLLFNNKSSYIPYRNMVLLALLSSILSYMLTNFFYTSERIQQVKIYNLCRILFINITTLCALYLIKKNAVETRLAFTYIGELALVCVFSYYFVKEAIASFSRQLMITCLKMGLPIMVSALFGIVINFSDKYFLEKYGTLKDLSNYYLAFSFSSIIPLIFASLQNVWMPLFMKEKSLQRNIEKTKKLISKLIAFFFLLALFIWLMFKILLLLNIVPGKYSSVVWILPILLATQICAAISPLFSNYLVYLEKTQLISLAGFFVSSISLGLGLWLIPIWGVYGAAFTSFISNLAYLMIYYYLHHTYKKKYLTNTYPV